MVPGLFSLPLACSRLLDPTSDGTMTRTAHHDPASYSASPSKDLECNDLLSLLPLEEGFVLTVLNDSRGCQLIPFSPLSVVT